MIVSTAGEKLTAKNKAKESIRTHLDKFILEEVHGFEDFSKGEVKKIQEQLEKVKERLHKILELK